MIGQPNLYAGYPLAWHFKCPFIITFPNVLFGNVASELGDSEHPEYVPFLMSTYTDRMTLGQRVINTIATHSMSLLTHISLPFILPSIRKYFPDCPPLAEFQRNASLFFTNSHPSISYPRVLPPRVIEIGAMQCRPARKLPEVFIDV